MKVLDLFSGIGGFSIGLERAGFETVAFCEIEDYPRAVLRRHWPDVPIYGDIKQLTGEQLRADGIVPDVICGGYPCQPFSVMKPSKKAKKTKDISGLKCIDLYESVGLDGSFPRMLVDTLNSVSTRYSLHWRLKDTPSGRLLFQRALSMPRTKETGSGLWLTPTAVQTDEHPDKMKKRMEKYPNGTTVGSLTSQVKYSPPCGLRQQR